MNSTLEKLFRIPIYAIIVLSTLLLVAEPIGKRLIRFYLAKNSVSAQKIRLSLFPPSINLGETNLRYESNKIYCENFRIDSSDYFTINSLSIKNLTANVTDKQLLLSPLYPLLNMPKKNFIFKHFQFKNTIITDRSNAQSVKYDGFVNYDYLNRNEVIGKYKITLPNSHIDLSGIRYIDNDTRLFTAQITNNFYKTYLHAENQHNSITAIGKINLSFPEEKNFLSDFLDPSKPISFDISIKYTPNKIKIRNSKINTENLSLNLKADLSYKDNLDGKVDLSAKKIDIDSFDKIKSVLNFDGSGYYISNLKTEISIKNNSITQTKIDFNFLDSDIDIIHKKVTKISVHTQNCDTILALIYPPYRIVRGELQLNHIIKQNGNFNGTITIRNGQIHNVKLIDKITPYIKSEKIRFFINRIPSQIRDSVSTPFEVASASYRRKNDTIIIENAKISSYGFSIITNKMTVRGEQVSGEGYMEISPMETVSGILNKLTPSLSGIYHFLNQDLKIRLFFKVNGTLNNPKFIFDEI